MTAKQVFALWHYLNHHIHPPEDDRPGRCDGTLRHSEDWLQLNEMNLPSCVTYLKSQGGYCDCEVIMNVAIPLRDAFVEADDGQ